MTNNSQFYVPRTCKEVVYSQNIGDSLQQPTSGKALSEFRDRGAYVLLGDPGAGKTECFKKEALQPGCQYIKAREFIGFDIEDAWIGKTLFIDGLDEVRAGSVNGLVPLDAVRKQLIKLDRPPFRISCREADWLGSGDKEDLGKVAPEGVIASLHLELLDEKDIREIAQHESRSLDVQEFLDWADRQGFMPLLGNPQILILMVKAVSGGEWPDTREQAFAMACREIVLEQNREHQQAGKQKYKSADQILNTAGMLFAHQLISGVEGYSLSLGSEDPQHPFFQRVFDGDVGQLEGALKTNLLRKGKSDEQREPIHRSVAEFLAAKYLAKLIINGFPTGRVLSLMTAADGGVVTPLRGLFAWFVTVCAKDRDIIVTRDPHGIVLYGDVTLFTIEQKQALLNALRNEAEKHAGFRSENWVASPFGALATPDMEEVFRDVIEKPSRDKEDQVLVDCVLDAMRHGVAYSGLEKTLWGLVKDHTRWPGIRGTALQILLRDHLCDSDRNENFLTLLDELNRGDIEDRDDNLLGILLTDLYPTVLPVKQVLDYFHLPKNDRLIGEYHYFWDRELIKISSKEMIAELLDQLCSRKELKEFLHHSYGFLDLLGELLVDGLRYWGDSISDSRLYDWLGIGLDKYGSSVLRSVDEGKPGVTVRQWISERPDRYKAILQEGTKRYDGRKKEKASTHSIYARLFYAEVPADIGRWYLDQAAAYKTGDIAEDYFIQAVITLQSDRVSPDLTLDDIYVWLPDHPQFKKILDDMLVDTKDIDQRLERAMQRNERRKTDQKSKSEWIARLVKHIEEIRQGTAPPAIFHDLAFAYNGHLVWAKGDTPHERLESVVSGHHDLYEAALQGLMNTKNREDLPSVKEIIATAAAGSTYYIAYAVLAGLDEICAHNPDDLSLVAARQYKHALAFYFTAATGDATDWVEMLVKSNPSLVSEVFIQYAAACLKAKNDHISGLYQLANNELWKGVAAQSAIPLLEKYPVRGKTVQINSLNYLLKAALRYDRERLSVLVDKKLQFASMDVMQRSRWLAAGLLLRPENYEKNALEFMGNSSARISAIAGFLTTRHEQWQPDYELPETTIGMLIQKLGSCFKPYNFSRSGRVTHEMNAADLVSGFIANLSSKDNAEATRELERLLGLPELKQWSDALRGALYRQFKLARDASFQQPDIIQIKKALNNAEPVNAADLMALTLSHLSNIALQIHDGSTNDFKQYWNTDSNGKPTSPKVEEVCRDTLLSDLKLQLAPLKIDAVKERYYADDKRADITVSYNGAYGFNVPIEIKRDTHNKLWSAIRDQLIQKYTRDPGAQGYGIYVVFWFGIGKIPPPPHGKRPRSATEMKEKLWKMMTKEERRLIGVCVIDCSVSLLSR